jgi:hypothetical protein
MRKGELRCGLGDDQPCQGFRPRLESSPQACHSAVARHITGKPSLSGIRLDRGATKISRVLGNPGQPATLGLRQLARLRPTDWLAEPAPPFDEVAEGH